MIFKVGDKVVRKKAERGYPWFKENITLTVKIADTRFQERKVWFYELNGSWCLDKFELVNKEFSDDEWE